MTPSAQTSLAHDSLGRLDADKVDACGEAYTCSSSPDAALGLASCAVTLALAAAGVADRGEAQPLLPLALAAKVTFDALGAAILTAEQAPKHRKSCSWCLLAAGTTVAMVSAVVPETRRARTALRNGQ